MRNTHLRPTLIALTLVLLLTPALPAVSASHHCANEIFVSSFKPVGLNPGACCSCVAWIAGSVDLRYIVGDVVSVFFVRSGSELPDVLDAIVDGLGHSHKPIQLQKEGSMKWESGDIDVQGAGEFTATVFLPGEASQTTTYQTLPVA